MATLIKEESAEIAQLVEHDLAKVGVASSSLVFRSKKRHPKWMPLFFAFFSFALRELFPD